MPPERGYLAMSEDIFRFSQLGLLWLSSGCRGQMSLSQSLSHIWLFATPWDCSTPGFPVHHPLPGACSNSCPLSRWCHPTISFSVVPFSSCPQSFPASGSFPVSQFFTSGGQSFGASASASVLPVNIQDWFPWGLTGLISLLSNGLKCLLYATAFLSIHLLMGI